MVKKENVKFLKLLTGELLLCELVSYDTDMNATIANPLAVVMMPPKANDNKPNIALAPWVDFSKDKQFAVKGVNIITVYNPTDDFVDEYCRKFSGLMTPNRQLILPGN